MLKTKSLVQSFLGFQLPTSLGCRAAVIPSQVAGARFGFFFFFFYLGRVAVVLPKSQHPNPSRFHSKVLQNKKDEVWYHLVCFPVSIICGRVCVGVGLMVGEHSYPQCSVLCSLFCS